MIVYKDILKKLKDAGYNTGTIMNNKLISQSSLVAIRHNKPISTKTINTICKLAKCQPGDILEYVEENDPVEE